MLRKMASKLSLKSTVKLPSGHEMPVLGFGVYQIQKDQVTDVCKEAIRVGYRQIDSAASYRNQGPSATSIPASGVPRSEVFFTTKIPIREHPLGYANAHKLVDAALEQTQLDYLDLVLIHAPYGGPENRKGAWKALVECVDSGKVRSIGVSNYGLQHLTELETYIKELAIERGGDVESGKGGIISVGQWEIHPWLPRNDIIDWCRPRGIAVQAWSPIVRGQRFGDPKVATLARKYGRTEAQILLRWSLERGCVPVVKSGRPERIAENSDIFGFELTEEEVKDITTDEYSPCSWDPTVEPLNK